MLCVLVLLTGIAPLRAASKAEERDYNSALLALNVEDWERAENLFGAFAERYHNSTNRVTAILFQAEARINLKNYSGAGELLGAGLPAAGGLADEYLFWLAETKRRAGRLEEAAGFYARLANEHPRSVRALEAIVAEAAVLSQLQQWERVKELLERPDGAFQKLSESNPAGPYSVRGALVLAEAKLQLGKPAAAEEVLQRMPVAKLDASAVWERNHLLSRVQLADSRAAAALATAASLTGDGLPAALRAKGWAVRGKILEQMANPVDAVAAWQTVLTLSNAPASVQREAMLHVSDLQLAQGKIPEAVRVLEQFLAAEPKSAVADEAWLALGELRLRQVSSSTNLASVVTNETLRAATTAFENLLTYFKQSPLSGRAQLGRGWCLLVGGQTNESEAAFAEAVRQLAPSPELAVAKFKLADIQAQRGDFAAALNGYREVVALGETVPAARSNLVEQALYQVLRVARESGSSLAAGDAMERLLRDYPDGELAGPALLVFGGAEGQVMEPESRRAVLEDFLKRTPDSKLAAGVHLAVAATYEQERKWTNAVAEYAALLSADPEESIRTRAEYARALALARAGDEPAAFNVFTNFIAAFPNSELAPLAQRWVADHFWREEDYVSAEVNYQLLYQTYPEDTNRFEAKMMAGRAALQRGLPEQALGYFTNLTSDPNCPVDFQAKALFATGDAFMNIGKIAGETNQFSVANYREAARRFSLVVELYTNTPIAALALGQMGKCYFQLGVDAVDQYEHASNALVRAIGSTADIRARSEAECVLGQVFEKWGQATTDPTTRAELLKQAKDHYMNVFSGSNLRGQEVSDPWWVKFAGLRLLSLFEASQLWDKVDKLCDALSNLVPAMKPNLEKKQAHARAEADAAKALNESR
ncbi:MAG: hypothetical protein RLY20_2175 [Verrucomicrobiota bacterium]